MESRVKVGLVGYGYWGPNLLRNYMELPSAWVKWVCDSRPDTLEKVRQRYPSLLVTERYQDLLGDPELDAILIATPISTHFELARAALAAGKHVFVEKPMTSRVEDADELVALARFKGLTLMVGHTFIYSPPVQLVKSIIDRGDLGDVYFVTSSRVNLGLHQRDVSVVWDLAPHDLAILQYWLGESPNSISVLGRGCVRSDIPDVAFMNLRFSSGVIAEVQVSWLSPVKLRRTVIVGNKRMLMYDDTENVEKVKLFDHGVDFKDPETFGEFQLSYRTGDILSPKVESVEPLFNEAKHFVECVLSGELPITDGAAGRSVVAALEAAEISLKAGGREETVSQPEESGAA